MEQDKQKRLLAIVALILGVMAVYFALMEIPNIEERSEATPIEETDSADPNTDAESAGLRSPDTEEKAIDTPFESRKITLTVWPDAESFDTDKKSFGASILGEDEEKTFEKGQEIDVATDGATKFYRVVDKAPTADDYFDFARFNTLMETWEGPDWRFTLKGATQGDGSILASEIFYQIQ